MTSERKILDRLRRRSAQRSRGIELGIGDDCAIYRPRSGEDLVFTTDFLIENVHFTRKTHSARDIGHKCLARGLSDLAAMGAAPRFCLFSLALPQWANSRFADAIFGGLLNLAERTGCKLAGGDLASAPLLIGDIMACGSVPRGKALRRDGAHPGDGIWVSGWLGGSALGLATLSGASRRKHLRPEPRIELGRFLRNKATALMDVSDGLSIDLIRLCHESCVAAEIETPPVYPGASIEQALHGGEDYELLFTAPPKAKVPAAFRGLPLTRIGVIKSGAPGAVRLHGKPLPPKGYDHFAKLDSSPN